MHSCVVQGFFILLELSRKIICTLLNGMCHWSSVTFMAVEIKSPVCDLCWFLACSTAHWGVHFVSNQCAVKLKSDNGHTSELQIAVVNLMLVHLLWYVSAYFVVQFGETGQEKIFPQCTAPNKVNCFEQSPVFVWLNFSYSLALLEMLY